MEKGEDEEDEEEQVRFRKLTAWRQACGCCLRSSKRADSEDEAIGPDR